MKIIDNRDPKNVPQVFLSGIPVSTTFTGKIAAIDSLFLRTYDEVVDLKDPDSTWDGSSSIQVKDYNPVNVTVTITGNAT